MTNLPNTLFRSARRTLALALVGVTLIASSCASTGEAEETRNERNGAWLSGSPILRQQIEEEAERLPWLHGVERLEAIRWFASIGEPAYATLLRLAIDPSDEVAASALAALGATGDQRLVRPLQIIPWSEERMKGDLLLERARTLLRLGDWSEIPALIGGLRHSELFVRSLCERALKESTGQRFGYDSRASEQDRERAVARWEGWWLARTGEGLLDQRK